MTKTRRVGFSKKRRRGGRKTMKRRIRGGRKTKRRRGGRKQKRRKKSRTRRGGSINLSLNPMLVGDSVHQPLAIDKKATTMKYLPNTEKVQNKIGLKEVSDTIKATPAPTIPPRPSPDGCCPGGSCYPGAVKTCDCRCADDNGCTYAQAEAAGHGICPRKKRYQQSRDDACRACAGGNAWCLDKNTTRTGASSCLKAMGKAADPACHC